jgi:hypothetical protein
MKKVQETHGERTTLDPLTEAPALGELTHGKANGTPAAPAAPAIGETAEDFCAALLAAMAEVERRRKEWEQLAAKAADAKAELVNAEQRRDRLPGAIMPLFDRIQKPRWRERKLTDTADLRECMIPLSLAGRLADMGLTDFGQLADRITTGGNGALGWHGGKLTGKDEGLVAAALAKVRAEGR